MTDQRLITKYANRRLYDTTESRYVTLEDIEKLVRDGIDFIVVARGSQADITENILLQVLSEQEHTGEHMMNRNFLCDAIRAHGGPQQGMLGSYLEQSASVFASQTPENRAGVRPTQESLTSMADLIYSRWIVLQNKSRPNPALD